MMGDARMKTDKSLADLVEENLSVIGSSQRINLAEPAAEEIGTHITAELTERPILRLFLRNGSRCHQLEGPAGITSIGIRNLLPLINQFRINSDSCNKFLKCQNII